MVKGFELGATTTGSFNSFELLVRIDTHPSLRRAHLDLEDLTQKLPVYFLNVFDAIFKGELIPDTHDGS